MHRLIILLLSLVPCLSLDCIGQKLSFGLSLDTDTLIECQDIWISASIANQTADTQGVQSLVLVNTFGGIRFFLRDAEGKDIPESGGLAIDNWGNIAILPHDSLTKAYNLNGIFSTSGINDPAIYNQSVHYLKQGTYTLEAHTFTGTDTLRAATIRFNVRQRPAQEDEAFQLLQTADSAFGARDKKSKRQYEAILEKYPNSVYTPYIYGRLIFIYRVVKIDKLHSLDLVQEFAERHPNNSGALREVKEHISELIESNRKSVVESLARDHPDTKVGRFCQRKLKEMNNK